MAVVNPDTVQIAQCRWKRNIVLLEDGNHPSSIHVGPKTDDSLYLNGCKHFRSKFVVRKIAIKVHDKKTNRDGLKVV
jgi:hypothetical protein